MTVFRFFFLTLLVIQLGACSNNDSNELIELDKIQKSSVESTPSDDEIDVYSYVSERSNIFGNVLILSDYDELNVILEEMENRCLQDLRVLYDSLGFYSPVLESHITYDSIFTDIINSHGLSEDDIIDLDDYNESLDDLIAEEFKSAIAEYPHLINYSIYENETFIEPIGDPWTIEGIYNEKNIFIVDKYVHSFNEEITYTIPIQYFHDAIANMSTEDLIQYVQNISSNNNENAQIISRRSPFIHKEKDGKYKMTLRIKAFDLARWDGEIIRRLHVNIRNFKNNCLSRINTDVQLSCKVDSRELPSSIPIQIELNENRNIMWKTFKAKNPSGLTIIGSNYFIIKYLQCNISNAKGVNINLNINN